MPLSVIRIALLALFLAAPALAQDKPEPDPPVKPAKKAIDPAVVRQHLSMLDHRLYREREKATGALLAMGVEVVPFLERYVQRTPAPSIEARKRAEGIVRRIALIEHWKSFTGGTKVGELQATLRCDKPVYLIGEQIKIKLEVRNLSKDKAVKCVLLATLDAQLPTGDSQNPSSSGRFSVKEIKVKGGGRGGHWSSRSSGGKPATPTDLAAGKIRSRSFNLRDYMPNWGGAGDLKPGVYQIKVELFTQKILKLPKNLTTNAVTFQIKAKR